LISRLFNHVPGRCALPRWRGQTARLTFLAWNALLALLVKAGCDVNWEVWNLGGLKMAFRPFITRLSVVTAYIAFAFVGAIVLGVF